ncbi:unnamed protein product, partial [Brenthis ino]
MQAMRRNEYARVDATEVARDKTVRVARAAPPPAPAPAPPLRRAISDHTSIFIHCTPNYITDAMLQAECNYMHKCQSTVRIGAGAACDAWPVCGTDKSSINYPYNT